MAGGSLYMQIQIPDAFPLTLPFCSGRIRKNCGVCIFFYLFLYVSCVIWFSFTSYFIIFPILFLFCGYIVAAFFLLFVYFALNFLLNPSFLLSQTWINTLKHHFSLLPFPFPFLFYFHVFYPFPSNIIIFSSAFIDVFLSHELSCPFFFGIFYFTSGETQGFGPFFLNSAKLERNHLKNVWAKLCPNCPVAWGWLGANKFLFSKFNFS